MKKLYLGLGGLLIVVAVVVGIVVAVSGKNNDNMSSMTMNTVATNTVMIQNYMFSPMDIQVKVGTTVTWTNMDSVNHTVTADTNSTDAPSSMDIAHGKSYSFTFKKAGTYTYHCFPHPFMHGAVKVTS
jgi:plastocyanin